MKTLLSLLFLTMSGLAFGQLNLAGLDKQSFLIGTLDDYMGHQQTFTASNMWWSIISKNIRGG